MQVEFSRFVEGDLQEIGDYIAQDNPTRSLTFVREIRAKLHLVGLDPVLYQLRPEIGEGARVAVMGRYVILFHIVGNTGRVERVLCGARDLAAQFDLSSGG